MQKEDFTQPSARVYRALSLFEFTNLASVSGALLGEPARELLRGAGLRPVEDDHPTVRRLHLVHEAPVTGHSQIIYLGL